MRVAVVHNFRRGAAPSGENVVVHAEVAALSAAGVDVRLVAMDNDEMDVVPLSGLRAASTVATGFGASPLDRLDGFRPDVIHVHNLFPYFGTRWLRHAPCPVVTTAHNFRAMCANGYLFRAGSPCTACVDGRRWSGVRYGCYRGSRLATVPLAIAGRSGAGGDPLLQAATRVLVLSERSRRVYQDAGLAPEKLVRDWHFVPADLAPAPAPAPAPEKAFWLFVGRLSAEKGISRLVEEWPLGHRLVVVGDGPDRPELERAAAARPIELVGSKSRREVVDTMLRALGLVFPSLWQETFGLVYAEALSAGLPVLAFPANVVADAVAGDGTGLVASWDAVPEALDEAAALFPTLRGRCREVFEERYTESAFVCRRTALYDGLRLASPQI
jgi:glycosyltransferase involved in cell wall biosynthesis